MNDPLIPSDLLKKSDKILFIAHGDVTVPPFSSDRAHQHDAAGHPWPREAGACGSGGGSGLMGGTREGARVPL